METSVPLASSPNGPRGLDAREILSAAPHPVLVAAVDGAIIYANPAACLATGYDIGQLQTMFLPQLLAADSVSCWGEGIEAQEHQASSSSESRLSRRDGRDARTEFTLQRLIDGRYLAIGRAVSDGKPVELHSTMERRVLELMATDAPLADILNEIALGVEAELAGSLCLILLADEAAGSSRVAAELSLSRCFSESWESAMVGESFASDGTPAQHRCRVVVADRGVDAALAQFQALTAGVGMRSCWSEPILSIGGSYLGSLAVYRRVAASGSEPEDLEPLHHATHLARVTIERDRRMAAAQQRHELFSRLAQQIPGVMFECRLNPDGKITFPYLSEAFEQVWGISREGAMAKLGPLWRRILPDDRETLRESLRQAAESMQPWRAEYRIRLPSQGICWHHARAVPHRLGDGAVSWVGYVADITKWKEAEFRARQEEQHVLLAASVFDHAHEGIIITDAAGRILDVNEAGCEISGYTRGELLGRLCSQLILSEEDRRPLRGIWKSLDSAGSWRGEIACHLRNGALGTEMVTVSAVRDSEGAISHYIVMFTDLSPLRETQRRLENLAQYDVLTQLPNRVLVAERLNQAMAKAQQRGQLLAICSLDLDDFSSVNQLLGHDAGDRLLIEVAKRLKRRLRHGDTAARIGGDEFVLLLSAVDNIAQAQRAVARILADLSKPVTVNSAALNVTASIGMTLFPHDDADPDTLMRHADQAMYRAKQAGGNQSRLFDAEDDRQTRLRFEASARVRSALDCGEFSLVYQPKVNMRQGMVVGVEALVRWNHPERGQLVPDDFLQLVEGSEWCSDFEDWVLEEAVSQLAAWWQRGIHLGVSINVSASLLQQENFVARLGRVLARHQDAPTDRIELEVVEHAALEDIARVSANIERSKRLGVLFAIDDFGTGYSSLTYLRHLPVSAVKIDRSFVCRMLEDPQDLAIVRSVIQLAKVFGRSVIAEGVETLEQGRRLAELDCDLAQGFAIGRPMAPDRLMTWLQDYQPDAGWLSARPS